MRRRPWQEKAKRAGYRDLISFSPFQELGPMIAMTTIRESLDTNHLESIQPIQLIQFPCFPGRLVWRSARGSISSSPVASLAVLANKNRLRYGTWGPKRREKRHLPPQGWAKEAADVRRAASKLRFTECGVGWVATVICKVVSPIGRAPRLPVPHPPRHALSVAVTNTQ